MRNGIRWTSAASGCLAAAVLAGCTATVELDSDRDGKIPITTGSSAALEHFLEGRELADQIRLTEARESFERAVAADPDFALAHLMLANTATSALEFFDGLARAVELAESASEGERLLILAGDAGSRRDLSAQRRHLVRLVELYPEDERARLALAGDYFGRQEYDRAIEEYRAATAVAPEFSAAYNLLGYAYRAAGRFDEAERAFRRYIELIPDEPNPYDSYAELLMKEGRFAESIENYEKALEIDPQFVPSYVGIANNQIFLGRTGEARDTLGRLHAAARNDGERRQALFWAAVSYVHDGDHRSAEEKCREMLAIAEAAGDWAQMAGDLGLIGDLRLDAADRAGAIEAFDEAMAAMGRAEVNEDVKAAFGRARLYRLARAAIVAADLAGAESKVDAFADAVARRNIPSEVWQLHELQGLLALAGGDGDVAVEHLERANQQDPRVLYELARAYRQTGDAEHARESARTAAEWNQLGLNYAYVRARARELLAEL